LKSSQPPTRESCGIIAPPARWTSAVAGAHGGEAFLTVERGHRIGRNRAQAGSYRNAFGDDSGNPAFDAAAVVVLAISA
jgi:hypothetical protein